MPRDGQPAGSRRWASALGAAARNALKVLAAIFTLIAVFIAWTKWDINKVSTFCKAAKPGLSLQAAREIGEGLGISRNWAGKGIVDERTNTWVYYVFVPTTFGEVACEVHHDGTTVVSSHMSGS